jgi:hypothetical protein
MPETLAQQRARIARASRAAAARPQDSLAQADLESAQRTYAAARLAQHIERTLADAPPLTVEQRQRLARLLGAA